MKGSKAPMIISAALIIIAVLAGFYLYGLSLALEQESKRMADEDAARAEASVAAEADELDKVERELLESDVDRSDEGIDQIDSEF